MKKRNFRALIVGAASVAIALGVVAPASADSVGGGTWFHGISGGNVYSSYFNNTKSEHRASVQNAVAYTNSGWKPQNVWANAEQPADPWSVDYAYYDYR